MLKAITLFLALFGLYASAMRIGVVVTRRNLYKDDQGDHHIRFHAGSSAPLTVKLTNLGRFEVAPSCIKLTLKSKTQFRRSYYLQRRGNEYERVTAHMPSIIAGQADDMSIKVTSCGGPRVYGKISAEIVDLDFFE